MAKFISKYAKQIIVYRTLDANGEPVGDSKRIMFDNGILVTDKKEVIDAVRGCHSFGAKIVEVKPSDLKGAEVKGKKSEDI